MLRMMVRPRWVLALLLALAVAGGFAWLGQWQLGRAIASGTVETAPTETPVPLTDAAKAGGPIRDAAVGQKVTAVGHWVPGDEQIVSGRLNGGKSGWWVVSRFEVTTTGQPAIPVARGWASDEKAARAVADSLVDATTDEVTINGRLLPSEAPDVPADGADPHSMSTVSVAALINLWTGFAGQDVYTAYIVDAEAAPGLDVIDSPAPDEQRTLNWLNVFYAVEWVVFAGFAIFLWYRLVKDAWQREQEEAEEAAAALEAQRQAEEGARSAP